MQSPDPFFAFPALSFPTSSFLSLVFLFALLMSFIMSAVLLYHWMSYGKNIMAVRVVASVYFIGVAIFLGMMLAGVS
ncbi:MAG: hypothetical protein AAB938_00270 [Patescibacteria group bacterium]